MTIKLNIQKANTKHIMPARLTKKYNEVLNCSENA